MVSARQHAPEPEGAAGARPQEGVQLRAACLVGGSRVGHWVGSRARAAVARLVRWKTIGSVKMVR